MKRKISFILGILLVLGLSLACASAGADSGSQAEFAQLLGIPDSQAAVAVLLAGREDAGEEHPTDAITGATSRNPLSDAVTYVSEN